jgi:hypothetical protein
MTPTDSFFDMGAAMAAASYDIDRDELLRRQARAEVMNSPEAEPFRRELCKIACAAFRTAGEENCTEAILFGNLAKAATWHASYNRFTDSVLRALAKQSDLIKQSTVLLPAVAALHDKAGGGVLKTLGAAGALGGAALGSLAFLLSRNAQQSSAENAILLEKVKAYKQLKRDIQEDMLHNELLEADKVQERKSRYDV